MAILAFGADHALSQATLVATYALAGLGVVVVVGQAGQIALGQAALVGLGAYAEALLVTAGVPSPLAIPAAAAIAAAGGALASLPARRLGGLYFGMSTLAFALIVEEALVRWEPVTRGAAGLAVPALQLAGQAVDAPASQALVSVAALIGAMLLCARLFDSRLGRAWRAVREDEVAADACGIDPVRAKLLAFVVGGALSGVAGALYAHWIGFISPEQFGLMFSFELLMLAFIGGAQRLAGAAWGALVIVAIPQAISVLRDALPGELARSAGLETVVFGAVIVAVVLLRPRGLAGGR
ncbi:MAG: branched-chain amino acid ABC transporter permease [Proteobacteria bacterium]|nr:branched-chain amino acid ABC transporter permease [Pseudomonadota bacterium]